MMISGNELTLKINGNKLEISSSETEKFESFSINFAYIDDFSYQEATESFQGYFHVEMHNNQKQRRALVMTFPKMLNQSVQNFASSLNDCLAKRKVA